MAGQLAGTVALVTGGNSGIGRATAEALCRRGAAVVITGRDRARGADAERALIAMGGRARFVEMDAASSESIRQAIEQTVAAFGGLDFLVNNAGYEGPVGPVTDLDEAACDRLFAVNVQAPMMAAKHALPHLRRRGGGVLVNVASFLGTMPFPPNPGYSASKAALIHFTGTLAATYGGERIRCYAVCPYITDTSMIERVSGGLAEVRAQLTSLNPSGRIAAPSDIAGVIADLCSGVGSAPEGLPLLVDAGGVIATSV
jgi:NAD(P)-dependent dehydrogenase (short-subunit alcohol dehydrogenase family)